MTNEVLPGIVAAGETDLPTVEEFVDTTILKDAQALRS